MVVVVEKKRRPDTLYPVMALATGRMPDDAQLKLQETLTKIINEGSGGLICIIL